MLMQEVTAALAKIGKWLWSFIAVSLIVTLGGVSYFSYTLPDSYIVTNGDGLHLGALVTDTPQAEDCNVVLIQSEQQYQSTLRLLGAVPIKQVTVTVVDAPVVQVCGTPFGIKLYTDGVLVVGLGDVTTAAGLVNPAAAAGIRVGDCILAVDGQAVTTNTELAALINACEGRSVHLTVRRDGIEFEALVSPARPLEDSGYRAGMWVRDSSAGIGTLTFYDATAGIFAGLGHAVCDTDTGEAVPIAGGEIVPACIRGVKKSTEGTPGELHGYFEVGSLGDLQLNVTTGLYGQLTATPTEGISAPVAMCQEVQTGKAQILTTIDGHSPALFDVEIEQVRKNASPKNRHMIIRVTDEQLLVATGGIVQGMSGSPILQNGKLVGAVTHVLIDNPTKGYGIFAETMLETAKSVEKMKKAG